MKALQRSGVPVAAAFVILLAACTLAYALLASPASAFSSWQHDSATECTSCHGDPGPSDATCAAAGCHPGFKSYPGRSCWSCHAPGQDTSSLSSPGSACSQECHLWKATDKAYVTPSTHGAAPHRGSTSDCTRCHETSASVSDPGDSPHHSGRDTGFTDCRACHTSPQRHAGKVACATCHRTARAYHLYQASSPGSRNCTSCHKMKHDGRTIALSKCSACHKGSGGRAVRHSSTVTKQYVCSGCHKQKLHARSVSKAVKSCRTCHGGKVHVKQPTPAKSKCTKCHSRAARHANGYQCTLCHRRSIHVTRPRA